MFWNLSVCAIFLFGSLTTLMTYPLNGHQYDYVQKSTHSVVGENVENYLGGIGKERKEEFMENHIGIFEQAPENFDHTIQVSACVVRAGDHILALQRGFHKYDPGKWEVPGGKFLEGETLKICASRELFEETSIEENFFQEIGVLYVRRKEGDFTLRVVFTELQEFPNVRISKEHHSYRWVTVDEMRNLDLIKGEELLIDMYFKAVALKIHQQ